MLNLTLRPYQEDAVNELLDVFKTSSKAVLSIAPGGGKTATSLMFAHRHSKNALVLAHGTNVLKNQWVEFSKQYGIKVDVILPQSAHKIDQSKNYDLIIIDEAHEFYTAKTVQNIIKTLNPKRQLLLTGTPSKFVALQFPIVFIEGMKLIQENYMSDVYFGLATTTENIKKSDYNDDGDLGAKFVHKKVSQDLDLLLESIIKRISNGPLKSSPVLRRLTSWASVAQFLGKTMIACHNIKQAQKAKQYFDEVGVLACLSTSEEDLDSLEIQTFKNDPNQKILIVVRRGILGFDMAELVNVVDMTASQNIDRIYQLYARVMRKHQDFERKYFFKLSTEGEMQWTKFNLEASLCMLQRSFISKFNGRNLNSMEIPVIKVEDQKASKSKPKKSKSKSKDKKSKTPTAKPPRTQRTVPVDRFFYDTVGSARVLNDIFNKQGTVFNEVAFTTIGEIRVKEFGEIVYTFRDLESVKVEALKYETRNEFYKGSGSAYQWALRNKKLDEVCAHMKPGLYLLDLKSVKAEALRYETRNKFQKGSSGAYGWAFRNKKLDEVCAHMKPIYASHDLKSVKAEALRYETRSEFQKGSRGAYKWALRNKKLDEVCANMKK